MAGRGFTVDLGNYECLDGCHFADSVRVVDNRQAANVDSAEQVLPLLYAENLSFGCQVLRHDVLKHSVRV